MFLYPSGIRKHSFGKIEVTHAHYEKMTFEEIWGGFFFPFRLFSRYLHCVDRSPVTGFLFFFEARRDCLSHDTFQIKFLPISPSTGLEITSLRSKKRFCLSNDAFEIKFPPISPSTRFEITSIVHFEDKTT